MKYTNTLFINSAVAFFFLFFLHGTSIGTRQQGISYNVLQISEGTNRVGIVRGIWAFAYVLLYAAFITNLKNKKYERKRKSKRDLL